MTLRQRRDRPLTDAEFRQMLASATETIRRMTAAAKEVERIAAAAAALARMADIIAAGQPADPPRP